MSGNMKEYPFEWLDWAWESKLVGMRLAEWVALPVQRRRALLTGQAKRHSLDYDAWQKGNNYTKAKMLYERAILSEQRNRVVMEWLE